MYGGKSGNRILHSGVMVFLQGFELRSHYTRIPGKTGQKIRKLFELRDYIVLCEYGQNGFLDLWNIHLG